MRTQSSGNSQIGDAVDSEINRVIESFSAQKCLNRANSLENIEEDSPAYIEIVQEFKEALEIELATFLPIVKLASGKYLIGTKQR